MHTTVITINFRSVPWTRRLLESIEAYPPAEPWEVIVANNSPEETADVEKLAATHPRVRVLTFPQNTYFAPACNAAARVARGHYLAFVNTDVEIRSSALRMLTDFLETHSEYAAAGGGIVDAATSGPTKTSTRLAGFTSDLLSQSVIGTVCERLGLRPSSLTAYRYAEWDRESDRDVDAACNAFLVIRRDIFHDVGGFSPELLLYYTEDDLGWKLRARGLRTRYLVGARAWHAWSTSTLTLPPAQVRALWLWDRYHHFRAHFGRARAGILCVLTALLHPSTVLRLPSVLRWVFRLRSEWHAIQRLPFSAAATPMSRTDARTQANAPERSQTHSSH